MTQSHVDWLEVDSLVGLDAAASVASPFCPTLPSVSLSGRQTCTHPVALSQVGQDDAGGGGGGVGFIWHGGRMLAGQAGRNSPPATGGGSVAGMVL